MDKYMLAGLATIAVTLLALGIMDILAVVYYDTKQRVLRNGVAQM